ncbi:hypothetical protein GQ54DRAFT_77445, partial [Martensiomyces pterosporus]
MMATNSMPSECPVKHSQQLASPPASPATASTVVHVIVADKGSDPEKDGHIIAASATDTDLTEFRQSIATRFSADPNTQPSAIALEDSGGAPISTFQELSQVRVAYLSFPLTAREAPLVPGYPLVGIIPYMLKDQRAAQQNFFDVHGDTLQYYLFDTNVLSTRDPVVAREMMNDSEYFYKKVL